MNKTQKGTWFGLFLGVPMVLIPGGVAVFIAYDKGMSFTPLFMFTFIALWGGLFWLSSFFACKRKKRVTFDERDRLISKRATLAAYVVLWVYFVAACVIPWWLIGPKGSISVNILPIILIGGLAIFSFVGSLATIIQYGLGEKGAKS